MTDRLRVRWPDPEPFRERDGRPIRILAVSDEPDPSLDSAATREGLGTVDLVIGAGDLEPDYLGFVTDAVHAPLRYVRGNHDVGSAWGHTERMLLPESMPDGVPVTEAGLRLIGFSGSPRYNERGMQVGSIGMWAKVLRAWPRANRLRPIIVVTHAPPRDVNDDDDLAHRGFKAFRWLAERLDPPLWLHGHTALVRRGIDDRIATMNGTTFYNCTGSTLIELMPPDTTADVRA
ncbi:MAG TPA: metallophosphoesterase [Candidatus Limnocylindria bacterium]|nr:metallophosphoesterase [Candidatus Limnocylindria bacterium]